MDRKNDDDVLSVWINEIFPLVEEYFFGDRTKLKDILHDDDVYIQNKSCFTLKTLRALNVNSQISNSL